MVEKSHVRVAVELRTDHGKDPMLHATLIQEGRAAAGGLAEVFAPGSIIWPDTGVGIRVGHKGPIETNAYPVRATNGEIRIAARATPTIVRAVQAGATGASIEFVALAEHRTRAGVREITRALVDAAALTDRPEYHQGRAEVRDRRVPLWL